METRSYYLLDDLEVRATSGKRQIRGTFKYGREAVLSSGGRRGAPIKEIMGENAFDYSINVSDSDISLLQGHSFDKILGARNNRSLVLKSDKKAVSFTATIDPAIEDLGYVRDTLGQIDAGLIAGISPGFTLPPERAVKNATTERREPVDRPKGMNGALIRTINAAVLYELSLVSRPAYTDASDVEVRHNHPLNPCSRRRRMQL